MPFPSPFSGSTEDDTTFDEYDAFVPEHLPEPGPFLEGHDVLVGEEHAAFHATTRDVFEERGVYDVTFGYNLARINLDTRHPGAGFRYARERRDATAEGVPTPRSVTRQSRQPRDAMEREFSAHGDRSILRAAFTPTTSFCPQSEALATGSFRAWNGLADAHGYDLVRVRVAPMHNESERINEMLARLEVAYLQTGELGTDPDDRLP